VTVTRLFFAGSPNWRLTDERLCVALARRARRRDD
jgi:hypothetical protein